MNDLVPSVFWKFPNLRLPSVWEDEDWSLPSVPSGLSVSEDDKYVYVEAAVPGIDPDKDGVDITFDKGVLRIKAEGRDEEKNRKYHRTASRQYAYQVLVPGHIDEKTEPEAAYDKGVVKISFKKVPEPQPKQIKIKK